MPTKEERKIIDIGGARYVSLPRGWLEFHGLKAGDSLCVFADDLLFLCTKGQERKVRRLLGGREEI